jgi:hypothetical protein
MKLARWFHRELPRESRLCNRLVLAKAIQEAAIAERIKNAEEVRIEECSSNGCEGDIGVSANETSIVAGARGGNVKFLKRIIVFKGRLCNGETDSKEREE